MALYNYCFFCFAEVMQIPVLTDIAELTSHPPRPGIMSAYVAERFGVCIFYDFPVPRHVDFHVGNNVMSLQSHVKTLIPKMPDTINDFFRGRHTVQAKFGYKMVLHNQMGILTLFVILS